MARGLLLVMILIILHARYVRTKLPSLDDEDEDNDLVSRKSKVRSDECDSESGDCPVPAFDSLPKSGLEMMDQSAGALVDLFNKYFKDIADGKLDLNKLLKSDVIAKFVKLFMMAKLPGGNPALKSALELFNKVSTRFADLQKGIKKDGLDLKQTMDKVQQVFSQVVPALILALQHVDENCQMRSLCTAARLASQTEEELANALNMFLVNSAGSFLDLSGKHKKSKFIKVVDCCSSNDESIYEKCAEKYQSEVYCPLARLNDISLLNSIDMKRFDFLKEFLPKGLL